MHQYYVGNDLRKKTEMIPHPAAGAIIIQRKKKLQKGLKRRNAVPVIRKAAGSVKASINMFSPMQWKQLVINTAGFWDTAFIRGMNMTAGHSKHFMTR